MNFQSMLENAGYKTRSYSGRCMYGERCLAVFLDGDEFDLIADLLDNFEVEIDNPEDADCVADAYDSALDELRKVIRGTKTDSMGRGIVVYWPDVPFDAALTNDDGNEDED